LDGRWRYDAFPRSVDSTLSGSYHVEDAFQQTDGTWGVTYTVTMSTGAVAKYSWLVGPDGSAQGGYAVGETVGYLRDFRWQQPAGC
jgi:hypothetical protein